MIKFKYMLVMVLTMLSFHSYADVPYDTTGQLNQSSNTTDLVAYQVSINGFAQDGNGYQVSYGNQFFDIPDLRCNENPQYIKRTGTLVYGGDNNPENSLFFKTANDIAVSCYFSNLKKSKFQPYTGDVKDLEPINPNNNIKNQESKNSSSTGKAILFGFIFLCISAYITWVIFTEMKKNRQSKNSEGNFKASLRLNILALILGISILGPWSTLGNLHLINQNVHAKVIGSEVFFFSFVGAITYSILMFKALNGLLKGRIDAPRKAVKLLLIAVILLKIIDLIIIMMAGSDLVKYNPAIGEKLKGDLYGEWIFSIFASLIWWGFWCCYLLKAKWIKAIYYFDNNDNAVKNQIINKTKSVAATRQTHQTSPVMTVSEKQMDKNVVLTNVGKQLAQCLQRIESNIVPAQHFQFNTTQAYISGCLYYAYSLSKIKGGQSEELKLVLRHLYQVYATLNPQATPQLFQSQLSQLRMELMKQNPDMSSPKSASESIAAFAYRIGIGQDNFTDSEQQYITQIANQIFNGMMILNKAL